MTAPAVTAVAPHARTFRFVVSIAVSDEDVGRAANRLSELFEIGPQNPDPHHEFGGHPRALAAGPGEADMDVVGMRVNAAIAMRRGLLCTRYGVIPDDFIELEQRGGFDEYPEQVIAKHLLIRIAHQKPDVERPSLGVMGQRMRVLITTR